MVFLCVPLITIGQVIKADTFVTQEQKVEKQLKESIIQKEESKYKFPLNFASKGTVQLLGIIAFCLLCAFARYSIWKF